MDKNHQSMQGIYSAALAKLHKGMFGECKGMFDRSPPMNLQHLQFIPLKKENLILKLTITQPNLNPNPTPNPNPTLNNNFVSEKTFGSCKFIGGNSSYPQRKVTH